MTTARPNSFDRRTNRGRTPATGCPAPRLGTRLALHRYSLWKRCSETCSRLRSGATMGTSILRRSIQDRSSTSGTVEPIGVPAWFEGKKELSLTNTVSSSKLRCSVASLIPSNVELSGGTATPWWKARLFQRTHGRPKSVCRPLELIVRRRYPQYPWAWIPWCLSAARPRGDIDPTSNVSVHAQHPTLHAGQPRA